VGFAKLVKVTTEWHLVGQSGWKIDIKTEEVSEDTFGIFVDTADPVLKPVFLQLARRSVQQSLEKLNEMMQAAGSAARMTIADPDEIDVTTLVDPGRFPQPEPDCVLNADSKWEKLVTLPDGTEIALVYIPYGTFLMGSIEAADDEESRPLHEAVVAPCQSPICAP
jgi:hypothetical protein